MPNGPANIFETKNRHKTNEKEVDKVLLSKLKENIEIALKPNVKELPIHNNKSVIGIQSKIIIFICGMKNGTKWIIYYSIGLFLSTTVSLAHNCNLIVLFLLSSRNPKEVKMHI